MRYYITMLFAIVAIGASAQNLAIKSNLLYDATSTINVGVEIGLGQRTTLDVSGNYNGWYTNEELNEKIKHWLIQPEFRYYLCEKMNGHFFGLHALATEYNVCGEHWLLSTFKQCSTLNGVTEAESRYQGSGYGAGIVYGYDWFLGKRLNLEFLVGAGYIHFDYDRYGAPRCAPYIESGAKDYFGLTKLGVSLVYIIK